MHVRFIISYYSLCPGAEELSTQPQECRILFAGAALFGVNRARDLAETPSCSSTFMGQVLVHFIGAAILCDCANKGAEPVKPIYIEVENNRKFCHVIWENLFICVI